MTLKENEIRHGAEDLAGMDSAQTASRRRKVSREQFDHAITVAVFEFLERLNEKDVLRLCRNGSLWINRDDARYGVVDDDSFVALGSRYDSRAARYGERVGACCVIDFEEVSCEFIFEDDFDYGDEEMDAKAKGRLLTVENGRDCLLSYVDLLLDIGLRRIWKEELND